MINQENKKNIILWLTLIAFMVFCMVFIGGITRLTDSGLSMVDWKPLVGAIPPLNLEQWELAFSKYKNFPEYKLINHQMTLSEFKMIFFWEYFHRLFGRMIGLVFIIPFIYFLVKKRLTGALTKRVLIAFILGGLQGLMGWYMVKSGLVNKPDVSHYRLAAHLGLAFLIIGYILWIILEIRHPGRKLNICLKRAGAKLGVLFLIVLTVQIIYGAFVAGLDAGMNFNTFPKMGRYWIPVSIMTFKPAWLNLFENPATIQFIHRSLAWLLMGLGYVLYKKQAKYKNFLQKRSAQFMVMMLSIQFVLGVVTLISKVEISLASAHQVGAVILLLLTLRFLFFTFTDKAQYSIE